MAAVAKAMASAESGLEVRDRMWLKITIPNAFIGKTAPSFLKIHKLIWAWGGNITKTLLSGIIFSIYPVYRHFCI